MVEKSEAVEILGRITFVSFYAQYQTIAPCQRSFFAFGWKCRSSHFSQQVWDENLRALLGRSVFSRLSFAR